MYTRITICTLMLYILLRLIFNIPMLYLLISLLNIVNSVILYEYFSAIFKKASHLNFSNLKNSNKNLIKKYWLLNNL